jgi:tRNA(Ile)-lysidine synthase
MITLLGKLPRKLTVAVSGGVDSMALLSFLKRNHDVTAAFYHHHTQTSKEAYNFLMDYLPKLGIELKVGFLNKEKPTELSWEEFWRNCRYDFFKTLNESVVTAHTLDDCVETWVWGSLHGQPQIIPYTHGNVLRPLLTTCKKDLYRWCENNKVSWVEDTSNTDTRYTRNYIRTEMMPYILKVNPGIHKVIKKKVLEKYNL